MDLMSWIKKNNRAWGIICDNIEAESIADLRYVYQVILEEYDDSRDILLLTFLTKYGSDLFDDLDMANREAVFEKFMEIKNNIYKEKC